MCCEMWFEMCCEMWFEMCCEMCCEMWSEEYPRFNSEKRLSLTSAVLRPFPAVP